MVSTRLTSILDWLQRRGDAARPGPIRPGKGAIVAKRVRMLGLFGVLAGAALATALPAQPALAWPAAYEGQPAPFQPGADAGFYIWLDGIGNHLATTGPGPAHHFQATISTDGQFERSDGAALEGADRFDLSADGHTITVDFTTLSRVDRIRWR